MASARNDVKRAIELVHTVHHDPNSRIHAVPHNVGGNEVQALAFEGPDDVLAALSDERDVSPEKQKMLEELFHNLVEEKITPTELRKLIEVVADYKRKHPKATMH